MSAEAPITDIIEHAAAKFQEQTGKKATHITLGRVEWAALQGMFATVVKVFEVGPTSNLTMYNGIEILEAAEDNLLLCSHQTPGSYITNR